MNLQLKNKKFLITGAGSGFGLSIAQLLLKEEAHVIAVSRSIESSDKYESFNGNNKLKLLNADLFDLTSHNKVVKTLKTHFNNQIDGLLINAGGPPSGNFFDLNIEHWHEGFNNVLLWKVHFLNKILPVLKEMPSCNILFLESVSVKQPINNLLLSNVYRSGIAALSKSLAKELARENIRVNLIGPGYHETQAMQRIFNKKAMDQGISPDKAKTDMEKNLPLQRFGNPDDFASLAVWLMSPIANYVTGQCYFIDGGILESTV